MQTRHVYVVQSWHNGSQLVLRLRDQNQTEAIHFHSWAALLSHLQELTAQNQITKDSRQEAP
jgi:hypothetical protein